MASSVATRSECNRQAPVQGRQGRTRTASPALCARPCECSPNDQQWPSRDRSTGLAQRTVLETKRHCCLRRRAFAGLLHKARRRPKAQACSSGEAVDPRDQRSGCDAITTARNAQDADQAGAWSRGPRANFSAMLLRCADRIAIARHRLRWKAGWRSVRWSCRRALAG
jgi:hypothetical protein